METPAFYIKNMLINQNKEKEKLQIQKSNIMSGSYSNSKDDSQFPAAVAEPQNDVVAFSESPFKITEE